MVSLSGGVTYTDDVRFRKQWTYSINITFKDEKGNIKTIQLAYPLHLTFNIIKNTFAETNVGSFTIYNLNASTREYIRQDRFLYNQKKYITFEVGYEGQNTRIFRGYIQEAYSVKSGTDILTKIEAWDIGQDQFVAKTFEAGTTFKEAVKILGTQEEKEKEIIQDLSLSTLDKLKIQNIGNLNGSFKTPTTIVGKPIDAISQVTGGHAFVDDGEINVLMNNECLDVGVSVISAKTGLMGTPQRRENFLVFDTLLNPSIKVGQLLEIKSETASKFNGTYLVAGFEHSGDIGGTKAGSRKTTISVLYNKGIRNSNINLTGASEKEPFVKVRGEERTEVYSNFSSDIEEVFNYISKYKGNMQGFNKKITENISWREMIQPIGTNNTSEQVYTQITREYLLNAKNIAVELQRFLDTYYGNLHLKLQISSGWRSKENNARWSNASKESVHLRGGAIDFRFIGLDTLQQFNKVFRPYYPKFCYWYRADSGNYYIHVQNTYGVGGAKRAHGQ